MVDLKDKIKEFSEWANEAQEDMVEKGRQKRDDKRSRLIQKNDFKVGGLDLVNKGEGESGILPKWFGRYRVLEGHESNTLTVKGEVKVTKLNVERVKFYKDRTSRLEEEVEGEIAEIINEINERDRTTKSGEVTQQH